MDPLFVVSCDRTRRCVCGPWWSTLYLCTRSLCTARQDSLVALRALVEYSYRARLRDITDMKVHIEATASELDSTLLINNATLTNTHRLTVSRGVW